MVIHYNQEKDIELKENTTLKEFLESKGLNKDGVAVAVDDKIIKTVAFDRFVLTYGMAVDVYNMVSGGQDD